MLRAAEIASKLGDRALAVCQYLLPNGRKRGKEFEVGSLRGEEGRSLRICLNGTGPVWKDFATGESGGDLLDLWAAVRCGGDMRQAMPQAADYLSMNADSAGTGTGRPNGKHNGSKRKGPDQGPTVVTPVPADAPEPPVRHPELGEPALMFEYHNGTGGVLFHVWRFEPKEFRPLTLWKTSDHLEWLWKGFTGRLPLYRQADLLAHPDKPVLIVEGEKTAEAAAQDFPELCVTTWPHGAKAIGRVDLTPLAGRNCTLWPDHDAAGEEAVGIMADRLLDIAGQVAVVELPSDLPSGWDLADAMPEGWTEETVRELIAGAKAKLREPEPESAEPEHNTDIVAEL